MNFGQANTTDLLETVLNRTRGQYLSKEDAKLVELLMCYRENGKTAHNYEVLTNATNKLTDRELIIFLMDAIDDATDLLVEGQTHMATGILGQCHAEIRKHLSK